MKGKNLKSKKERPRESGFVPIGAVAKDVMKDLRKRMDCRKKENPKKSDKTDHTNSFQVTRIASSI